MKANTKLKYLIGVNLALLFLLLLCVIAAPLLIQQGVSVSQRLIIEEDTLESLLIAVLFGVSFLTYRGFKRSLKAYGRMAKHFGEDKNRLASRLADAFHYIGTINVEIKEIQTILCGVDYYPQTKREFKRLMHGLTAKAMAFVGCPWIVIRLINRSNGRTIKEHAIEGSNVSLPGVAISNRSILEGRFVEGARVICSRQKNLSLLAVCILPAAPLSEEAVLLITAIINQIEVFFLLSCTGFDHREPVTHHAETALSRDTHF